MESELGSLPLLKALEHERNSADVGLVEPFKHLGSLLVVLRSWSSNEGEACEVDYGVNDGLASRVVKVFLKGSREIESTRVDWNDAATTPFDFGDKRDIVSIILGVDVGLLQDDADSGGRLRVDSGVRAKLVVVPVEILLVAFKDNVRGDRVPDGFVGEKDGLLGNNLLFALHSLLDGINVVLSDHEHERLKVLWRTSKPVLEGHHEGASVCGLVTGEKL